MARPQPGICDLSQRLCGDRAGMPSPCPINRLGVRDDDAMDDGRPAARLFDGGHGSA
jgi:hypothetical protein